MSDPCDQARDLDLYLEHALESLDAGPPANVDDEELAVLASGDLDRLPEADRMRILEQVATDPVARKVVADLQKSGLAETERRTNEAPRKKQVPRLIAAVLAVAACVVIIILIRGRSGSSRSLMNEAAKARDWLSRPLAVSSMRPPVESPFHPATALPPLKPAAVRTMGGGPNRFKNEMLATVSITVDDPTGGGTTPGLGSGVLISPEGWILTAYQVVAPAVQSAALQGGIACVGILTGVEVEDRVQARGEKLSARVYLADPAANLALLKLDSLPPGVEPMPYVRLAERATPGENCHAVLIGTCQGRTSWAISAGVVTGSWSPPERSFEKTRRSMLLTDCSFSPSDAGGLLANAAGELIGLNWTTRGERTDSTALHIPLDPVRTVYRAISTLDRAGPEPVPFDIWTAGLSASVPFESYFRHGGQSDPFSVLVLCRATKAAAGFRPWAAALFIDFAGKTKAAESTASRIPRGLWGMENEGRFLFDVCVVARADGILVVGYVGANGVVDRIRIDHDRDGTTDVLWLRSRSGSWTSLTRPDSLPSVDASCLSGLSRKNAGILENVLETILAR